MDAARQLQITHCARCGRAVDPSDHFEVFSARGPGGAAFCRTEHIVAWILRGAPWQFVRPWELPLDERTASGELILRRIRGSESIERRFDDLEALRAWASAGGFWSRAPQQRHGGGFDGPSVE